MAEKDKCNEALNGAASNLQRYPSKDQIIARLVQIRECTGKAESTLQNMPPNSQNDPKFYQLQEMLSEMREAEKRLLDILGDYEAGGSGGSPVRSRFVVANAENLQVMQQSSASASVVSGELEDLALDEQAALSAVAPELLCERESLKQRCLESQQRIDMLEKQRKLLLEACSRSSGGGERGKSLPITSHYGESSDSSSDAVKRMQVVRDGDSGVYSQRCGSAGGITHELANDPLARSSNLSELADKRLEIHSIISEIALLRRAKDESARKIELLQQALKRSEDGDSESGRVESPASSAVLAAATAAAVKSDSVEYLHELGIEENGSDQQSNIIAPTAEWLTDSFTETITRKLVEIQTMRQKLDALQSLVHTIPTPGSYPGGVENEVEMFSLKGTDSTAAAKDSCVNSSSRHSGSMMFGFPDRNLDFSSRYKSASSTSVRSGGYAGDHLDGSGKNRNRSGKKSRQSRGLDQSDEFDQNSRSVGCLNGPEAESPPPRQVRPVPIRAQPSGFGDSFVFPGLPRSDDNFLLKNTVSNQTNGSYLSQSSHEFLPPDERMSNSLFDPGRQWTPFQNSANVLRGPAVPSAPPTYCNSQLESFMMETNSVLKHLLGSFELVTTGLENQGKQIEGLKESIDRLTSRFGVLPCGDAADCGRGESRRRMNTVPDSLPDMLPDNEIDSTVYGHGSRRQNEMNFAHHQVKGINPTRAEMWGGNFNSACAPYPPEQLNVHHQQHHHHHEDNVGVGTSSSAFYSPNPSSSFNSHVKRPWASPGGSSTLEPSRLMLNNQVPPGNRTNNYWDNFRSQSRQNVLSSSSKSNESYNAVLPINPEASSHAQAAGVSSTNNFNRLEARHDKNPGAKPIKAVMMKHFVENIGSKKRNQEQQRQQQPQLLPQRSVSVGSMPHTLDGNPSSSRHVRHNGLNELNMTRQGVAGSKEFLNSPGDHLQMFNKLNPKEANVLRQAQQSTDGLKEVYAKVSQIRSEMIRQRTIETLRNLVQQSMLQDQMVEGHVLENGSLRSSSSRQAVNVEGGDPPMPQQPPPPPQISSPARTELNEILWGEASFVPNSSRLLPYAGVSGASLGSSHSSNDITRRDLPTNGTHNPEPFVSSSSSSRSFPFGAGRRSERMDTTEDNIMSGRGGVGIDDPWLSASFLHNETHVPSYLQPSKPNRVGISSEQDVHGGDSSGGVGGGSGGGESHTSNTTESDRISFLQFSESSSNLANRFREVEKSLAEGESDSKSSSHTDSSTTQTFQESEGNDDKATPSAETEETSKRSINQDPELSALRNSIDAIASFSPLREHNNNNGTLEADLDASLLNVSGATFLAEPSSPESSSPVVRSFSSSVKYKGRQMNPTNNPWISSTTPSKVEAEEDGNSKLTMEAQEAAPENPETVDEVKEEPRKSKDVTPDKGEE